MTPVKRPAITPSWWLQEQPEFGLPSGDIVWHDCPCEENEMFAVDLQCSYCGSSAPDFLELAVKLGQAHTVSSMLELNDHRLGWTIKKALTFNRQSYRNREGNW